VLLLRRMVRAEFKLNAVRQASRSCEPAETPQPASSAVRGQVASADDRHGQVGNSSRTCRLS